MDSTSNTSLSQESECDKTENDIDNSIYHSVQDKFGQYDKRSFRETIVNTLDLNDLRSVRKSLFDILKRTIQKTIYRMENLLRELKEKTAPRLTRN